MFRRFIGDGSMVPVSLSDRVESQVMSMDLNFMGHPWYNRLRNYKTKKNLIEIQLSNLYEYIKNDSGKTKPQTIQAAIIQYCVRVTTLLHRSESDLNAAFDAFDPKTHDPQLKFLIEAYHSQLLGKIYLFTVASLWAFKPSKHGFTLEDLRAIYECDETIDTLSLCFEDSQRCYGVWKSNHQHYPDLVKIVDDLINYLEKNLDIAPQRRKRPRFGG